MRSVIASGIILVCYWSGTLSRKQELIYKVGIKLCAQRCFSTESCTGIKMDSEQLHCQLIIDDTKKRNDNILFKLHPTVWNRVPHLQCEANERILVSKRKGAKCVPDGSIHSTVCKGKHDCQIKKPRCNGGVCLCTLGLYFSPKQNACLRACDEYGDRMDIYKGVAIKAHNDKLLYLRSMTHCWDLCVREKAFTCLTAEWNVKDKKCQFSRKGYQDVAPDFRVQNKPVWSLAQRRCK